MASPTAISSSASPSIQGIVRAGFVFDHGKYKKNSSKKTRASRPQQKSPILSDRAFAGDGASSAGDRSGGVQFRFDDGRIKASAQVTFQHNRSAPLLSTNAPTSQISGSKPPFGITQTISFPATDYNPDGKLTERISQATRQIVNIMATIQADTRSAIAAMEHDTQEVKGIIWLADQAGAALARIVEGAQQAIDTGTQIAVTESPAKRSHVASSPSRGWRPNQTVTESPHGLPPVLTSDGFRGIPSAFFFFPQWALWKLSAGTVLSPRAFITRLVNHYAGPVA